MTKTISTNKKSNKNNLIIIFVIITAVLGIAGFLLNQSGNLPSDFALSRDSYGGIAGTGDGYNFKIAGRVMTYKNEDYNLTNNQINGLMNKIDEVDFFKLDDNYNENECCDLMTTVISITKNGETKIVAFGSMGYKEIPEGLSELDDYLVDLMKGKD